MNEENLPWGGTGDGEEKGKEEGRRRGEDEEEEARSLCLPNMGPCQWVHGAHTHVSVCIFQDLPQHMYGARLRSSALT